MLDPDIFHEVLRANYSPSGNLFYIPKQHGEKKIDQFLLYFNSGQEFDHYASLTLKDRFKISTVWLYDQEHLEQHVCEGIRSKMFDHNTPDLHSIVDNLTFPQLAAMQYPSSTYPIWCHSELNSKEIHDMEQAYFIPCYYWYHALVSLDWFRHYRYIHSLRAANKADSQYRFLLYSRDDSGTRAYRKCAKQSLYRFQSQILHDWSSSVTVSSDNSSRIAIEHAELSGIQLVFETVFDSPKIHLTEKIFKPMVMSQAFIVWGTCGTLATLRGYGFRTFDSIWSEEYDFEPDSEKRMMLLADLVRTLHDMPQDQYRALYDRCLPIIAHNREWFYSSRFGDACWAELETNFDQAFKIKQELLKSESRGQMYQLLKHCPDLVRLPSRKAMVQQLGWSTLLT